MSDPIVTAEQPSASYDTRAFWIDQIYAGLFCAAGLDIRHDLPWFGWTLFAVGLCWLGYLRWEGKSVTLQNRMPNVLAIVVILITIGVMSYDIYDRHHGPDVPLNSEIVNIPDELKHYAPFVPLTPEQVRTLNIVKGLAVTWGKFPYQEIWDRAFNHETVLLDGRAFIHCTFDNVTFVYEGTAPFRMERQTINGPINISSDNPIVKGTIDVYAYQGLGAATNKPELPQ